METLSYKFDTLQPNKENRYIYQYVQNRALSNICHYHDFYELIFLTKGSCTHLVDDIEYTAQAHDLFLIRPGERHIFLSQSDFLELLCLSVAKEEFDALASVYSSNLKDTILQFPGPICIPCKLPLEIHYIQSKAATSYEVTDYKVLLFHLLKIFADHTAYESDMPELLRNAVLEMRKRENIKIGIPAFLSITHYSQTHLSRMIKKYFGIKLHDYILNLRLEAAYNDLILTTKAPEEISESVGYNSFSHFSKIFTKKYGITPAVLRKEQGRPTI